MNAKVVSVYDEGALEGTPLIGDKGFAAIVDADGERTLFDTGMRGGYLMHNLNALDADPDAVDRVVVSHVHNAHTGGLQAFLERRTKKIDVIAPPDAGEVAEIKLFGRIPFKRIGMPKMSSDAFSKMEMKAAGEWTQLSPNLFIIGTPPCGGTLLNPSVGENALVLVAKGGPVLICACCHGGVMPLMSRIEERMKKKIQAIIGGPHLLHMGKNDVYETAEMLKEKGPPLLHLNHCSGQVQRMRLREVLGLKSVNDFYAGSEIAFEL
jgi:7,8-dihydropterin-6-yl-methyl-4-(beta-D-ribofuranosyl)aminobenzene 5'-phosphate synthase